MNKIQLKQLITRIIKEELSDTNNGVQELFGFSAKEKNAKAQSADVEKAKQEIDKADMSAFFKETNGNLSNDEYIKLADIIRSNLKSKVPSFIKLFPDVLKSVGKTGVGNARYDFKGKILHGITLSTLVPILTPEYTDNIDQDKAKERMKKYLDTKASAVKEYADGEKDTFDGMEKSYSNAEIKKILKKYDYLGFDLPGEAINAILTHKDWKDSWDMNPEKNTQVDATDVEKLEAWRKDVISKHKGKSVSEDKGDTEIIKTPDGTLNTADANTKNKLKKDSDDGTAILVKKRGTALAESNEEPIDDNPVDEGAGGIEPIKKSVHSAIVDLESLINTTQDNRYKRYAQSAIKHLERAEDCLDDVKVLEEKANAKKSAEDEKADGKHADVVFKHISKKLNGKNKKQDIEPIKAKYHKVVTKLRTKRKAGANPERDAEEVWKHMLKEGDVKN